MLIERLMWGSDWNDPLTALLRRRPPASLCAACDQPLDDEPAGEHAGLPPRLLCGRCEPADQAV